MLRKLHVTLGLLGILAAVQWVVASQAFTTVAGTVVDSAGTRVPGVVLALERTGQARVTTTADTEGAYRFASVVPGAYTLRVKDARFLPFSQSVTVTGQTATVRVAVVLAFRGPTTARESADAAKNRSVSGAPGEGSGEVHITAEVAPVQTASPHTMSSAAPYAPGVADGRSRGEVYGQPDYLPPSNDSYAHVDANRFQRTLDKPLSTFGADVDTASYTNTRRFLSGGYLPPADAVRVEEMVNYFHFDYAQPRGAQPLAMTAEIGPCPWAPSHRLVLIGARARSTQNSEPDGRNLVLLIDVSGSMAPPDRLPMLKTALRLFVDTMKPTDRIAIVTYAGYSGVALPPTSIARKSTILAAIDQLGAGGSTNGAQGIATAYAVARASFMPNGVNRVILATDGDFNVGVTSQTELLKLIEHEKTSGIFLSVFGVGAGNLKDSTMEMLADHGNGHYAYLDSLQEARRVLIREGDATLETVAKDVKFQVEFNPAQVWAWKQIGYENRALAARDFNDDRKDGGEMGAGHTVTVLYEVVPVDAADDDDDDRPAVDPLKYQGGREPTFERQPREPARSSRTAASNEWLTVKARYKAPGGDVSEVITQPVRVGGRVQHLPLASAIAEFGLLLRDQQPATARWDALSAHVSELTVPPALSADVDGFAELVEIARGLVRQRRY